MSKANCDKCKQQTDRQNLNGFSIEGEEVAFKSYICPDCAKLLEPTGKKQFPDVLQYPCQLCGQREGKKDYHGYFACRTCSTQHMTKVEADRIFENTVATYGEPYRWKLSATNNKRGTNAKTKNQ